MKSIVSDILQYLPPKVSIAFSVSNKLVFHAESNTVASFVSSIAHNILFL